MKPQNLPLIILRLAGIITLIEIGIMAAVGIVHWRAGWNTVVQYGEGLVWAGFISVALGFMGIKGQLDSTRSFGYQYSLSVGDQPGWQRTKQNLEDALVSHRFLIVMAASGIISILAGWLMLGM